MYKGCVISIPVMAYKDWRIQYNFEDEESEQNAYKDVKKEFPYKDKVDKVR